MPFSVLADCLASFQRADIRPPGVCLRVPLLRHGIARKRTVRTLEADKSRRGLKKEGGSIPRFEAGRMLQRRSTNQEGLCSRG